METKYEVWLVTTSLSFCLFMLSFNYKCYLHAIIFLVAFLYVLPRGEL